LRVIAHALAFKMFLVNLKLSQGVGSDNDATLIRFRACVQSPRRAVCQ